MSRHEKRITVLAAISQEALETHGADIEYRFDTVAEAKQRAQYYLTAEYAQRSESSVKLGYSQVLIDDEVRYDYFGK